MKINEVMKETGLTKKAIYYYEEEGLISPRKDEENNYRIYEEEDVKRLLTIHSLRKVDFTIKDIHSMLVKELDIKQIINKQLSVINERIRLLTKNKGILEHLIEKGTDSIITDLQFTIKYFDEDNKNTSGYMQKELDRILPGMLGKMFAIHYRQFLDEPLNTEKKKKAWVDLIGLLDSLEEVQYPEDMKEIINEMFEKFSDEDLMTLKEKAESVTNKILERNKEVSELEKIEVKNRLKEYENSSQYQKDLKIQKYMMQNIAPIFEEVNKYMCVLSARFEKYNKILTSNSCGDM